MDDTTTKISVWMDYSVAYLIEFPSVPFEIKTIESNFSEEQKTKNAQQKEGSWKKKINDEKTIYYKKIINAIANFDEVLLYGSNNSINKLVKLVSLDGRCIKNTLILKQAGKMSSGQQKRAFVKGYFAK